MSDPTRPDPRQSVADGQPMGTFRPNGGMVRAEDANKAAPGPGGATGTSRPDDIIPAAILSPLGTARPADGAVLREGGPGTGPSRRGTYRRQFNDGQTLILTDGEVRIDGFIARSGEAELYRVQRQGQTLAFKYYDQEKFAKEEVLQQLKDYPHPGILVLVGFGEYEGRSYELAEFAFGKTLLEHSPLRDEKALENIVRQVVEGLQHCHTMNIIHRDIKPENLFFCDQELTRVVIGDWGISSILEEGSTSRVTSQAQTHDYAAPERFRGVRGLTKARPAEDYYSLGVTLVTLWAGKSPFDGAGLLEIVEAKASGYLELPSDLPRRWQQLVRALTTPDHTARLDYLGVQRWLKGEELTIRIPPRVKFSPFGYGKVDGQEHTAADPRELADLMQRFPARGKEQLYGHAVDKWLLDNDLLGLKAPIFGVVEWEFQRNQDAGLTKAIYLLDPQRAFRGHDGSELETAFEVAAHFEAHAAHYEVALQNPADPFFLYLAAREESERANEYHAFFQDPSSVPPRRALNMVILKLQGSDAYYIPHSQVATSGGESHLAFSAQPPRLDAPRDLVHLPEALQCAAMEDLESPDSKLSVWLADFERLNGSIAMWRTLGERDPLSLRMALQCGIPVEDEVMEGPDDVRRVMRRSAHLLWAGPHPVERIDGWLKHYQGVTLTSLAVEALADDSDQPQDLLSPLAYGAERCQDANLDLSEVINAALPTLGPRLRSDLLTVDAVADRMQSGLRRWLHTNTVRSTLFVDRLKSLAESASQGDSELPGLWRAICQLAVEEIPAGVGRDLAGRVDDRHHVQRVLEKRREAIETLHAMAPECDFRLRMKQEDDILKQEESGIRKRCEMERRGKEADDRKRRASELAKERDVAHAAHEKDVSKAYSEFVAFGALSVALLFSSLWMQGFRLGQVLGSDGLILAAIGSAAVLGIRGVQGRVAGGFGVGCAGPILVYLGAAIVWFLAAFWIAPVAAMLLLFVVIVRMTQARWRQQQAVRRTTLPQAAEKAYETNLQRISDWALEMGTASVWRRRAELASQPSLDSLSGPST